MLKTDMIQIKKGDCILMVVIVMIFIILLVRISMNENGNLVHVTVSGKTTTYSLFENKMITFVNDEIHNESEDDAHISNLLVIENGVAYMEWANCKDQVCVKHKPISKNGEMIICLPNEIYVEVENSTGKEVDN